MLFYTLMMFLVITGGQVADDCLTRYLTKISSTLSNICAYNTAEQLISQIQMLIFKQTDSI